MSTANKKNHVVLNLMLLLGLVASISPATSSMAYAGDPNSEILGPSGTGTNGTQYYSGPSEVAGFVQKFVNDADAQGVNAKRRMNPSYLRIQISKLDHLGSGVIGLCQSYTGGRTVTLDPDFWYRVNDTQKELLMHHELGHCILGRPHYTGFLSNGAYASIMYPLIMSSATYRNNYVYYQRELFGGSNFNILARGIAESEIEESPETHICDVSDIAHVDESL